MAVNNDVSSSNTDGLLPEDTEYDANGNIDRAAFRQARLRSCLRRNTTGMGGVHHHQGNNHRVPDDPYAKIKFTIPPFLGHYDAEGYLDWEMTVEQKLAPTLCLSIIEFDKLLVSLRILPLFGGMG